MIRALAGGLLALLLPALPCLAEPGPASARADEVLREFLWEELAAMPADRRPKVGVAFSGGGGRGYAHVGVIQVLEQAGFPVDVVAGTSMGALIGVAFADGMSSSRMQELLINARLGGLGEGTNFSGLRLVRLVLSDALLSTRPIVDFLRRHIGEKNFYQLRRPFATVATDLKTGEKIVFTDGPVAPAVRASVNIPGLFEPVQYRHRYLVDGGVVDFVPVDLARQLGADWVLASVVEGDYTRSTFPNVFFTLTQVMDITGAILSRQSKLEADFVVQPRVGRIKVFEFWRGREAYEQGVQDAHRRIVRAQEDLLVASGLPLLRWLREKP